MNKIKMAATKAQTAMMMRLAGVKREDGDHLLEVLGVVIIAVILLVLFRTKMVNMFTKAMNNTEGSVTNLFNAAE